LVCLNNQLLEPENRELTFVFALEALLTAIYHMLKDGVEHHDLGA
jgi:hypothetical protein